MARRAWNAASVDCAGEKVLDSIAIPAIAILGELESFDVVPFSPVRVEHAENNNKIRSIEMGFL